MPDTLRLEITVAVIAILAVIFSTMGWTAYHYHQAWVDVQKENATLQASLDQTTKVAKDCSDNTQKIQDANDKKQVDIQKAEEQANKLAKVNESMAQKILAANPHGADACVASLALIKDYKTGKVE